MDQQEFLPHQMHWNQMNCSENSSLTSHSEGGNCSFYISENPPPDIILPSDISCIIHHPLSLDGITSASLDVESRNAIIDFIKTHDCTESGNITELSIESFDRLSTTPCFIGTLLKHNEIIGTMITLIFRAKKDNLEFITTYTTFLCIHMDYREMGLAMILIRSIMKDGYLRYGIHHGYYMTSDTHHPIHNEIKSWYRPINIKKAQEAGFTLQNFDKRGDRRPTAARQKLAYHISKPSVLPVRASYENAMMIIGTRPGLCINPTPKEFIWLSNCFEIYTVGNYGMFMLFPMTTFISQTGKRVRNAQLTMMIGDVLPHALWIANEKCYDLLYGWCGSDITKDRVTSIRGLVTTAKSYLELYNTKSVIPNNDMIVPIF